MRLLALLGAMLVATPRAAQADTVRVAPSLEARAAAGESVLDCILVLAPPPRMPRARARAALEATWTASGLTATRRYRHLPLLAARVPAALLPALADDPLVGAVVPVRRARALRREGRALMHVEQVFARGFDGAGVGIAILDTGIDYTHTELRPGGTSAGAKTILLADTVDNDLDPRDGEGHGTAVAGIAAGSSGGVARGATLVAIRVLDENGEGSSEQILAGIDALLDSVRAGNPFNVRVANLSLGGYDGDWPPGTGACDGISADFVAAFEELSRAGVLVVVAAGNGGCSRGVSWPACISHALAVGAVYDDEICQLELPLIGCVSHTISFGEGQCTSGGCSDDTDTDRITCYSDSGSALGVWAPSHCANTTARGGGTLDCFGGTSAAAPYTAGVAALLAQAYPTRPVGDLRAALIETGRPRTDSRNNVTRNRIDALAALDSMPARCGPPPVPAEPIPTAAVVCREQAIGVSWRPVHGAASYTIEVAASAAFGSPTALDSAQPSASVAIPEAAGSAVWLRLRSRASCGAASSWSPAVSVAVRSCSTPRRRLPRR